MNRSPEELGLAPDLSRLPIEVRDLIRHGGRDGHAGCSNAIVEVCATMFRAGYSLAEVWMVMTDPTHGIAEAFFSTDGEQAEAWLERIVSEADVGNATRTESYTPTLLHRGGGGSHTIKTGA